MSYTFIDSMIDNAATASQNKSLIDCPVTRQAIIDNVIERTFQLGWEYCQNCATWDMDDVNKSFQNFKKELN